MVDESEWLAARFDSDRNRLRAVAYRMLGSFAEAEDAVQESWIRVSRTDTTAVENMSGWLTTIVARVSLNMLESRKSRREDLVEEPESNRSRPGAVADPEQEALLADSVGTAMLAILDTLTPAERLAFVLHDIFAVPFEEIGPIVDRSPTAARQLASRARRRFRDHPAQSDEGHRAIQSPASAADAVQGEKAEFIRAFLAASREGDFEALLTMLAPDIVVRADNAAVHIGVATGRGRAMGMDDDGELHGADAVSRAFAKLSWQPVSALINGSPGLAYARDGVPRGVVRFSIDDGLITAIDIQADLAELDVVLV